MINCKFSNLETGPKEFDKLADIINKKEKTVEFRNGYWGHIN